MAEPYTLKNLAEVGDAASAHGLDGFWEAWVAGRSLEAERTGVAFFRLKAGRRSAFAHRHEEAEEIYVVLRGSGKVKLDDEISDVRVLDAICVAPQVARAFEAGPDGLEFIAFGPHHPGDGEPVEDPWVS